ncbi:hypothetical protein [Rarobacter incanus]|nr:hypothetical protein [Rarobacter incanus]
MLTFRKHIVAATAILASIALAGAGAAPASALAPQVLQGGVAPAASVTAQINDSGRQDDAPATLRRAAPSEHKEGQRAFKALVKAGRSGSWKKIRKHTVTKKDAKKVRAFFRSLKRAKRQGAEINGGGDIVFCGTIGQASSCTYLGNVYWRGDPATNEVILEATAVSKTGKVRFRVTTAEGAPQR